MEVIRWDILNLIILKLSHFLENMKLHIYKAPLKMHIRNCMSIQGQAAIILDGLISRLTMTARNSLAFKKQRQKYRKTATFCWSSVLAVHTLVRAQRLICLI